MRITRAVPRLFPLLALLILNACMHMAARPQNLDLSRTRISTNGLYRATIRPDGDSIPQGRLHTWLLTIEDTIGTAIDSAAITVDGGMPQHGHGLPTKPRVTRALGDGVHRVDGMKFNMGGWWVVSFAVKASAGADSIVFNLDL